MRDRFLQFIGGMNMSMSYKAVMLLALLETIAEDGRAMLGELVGEFRRFYLKRKSAGIVVERAAAKMSRVSELDDVEVQRVLLGMPYEKFERRHYLKYDRDLAYVRFDPRL